MADKLNDGNQGYYAGTNERFNIKKMYNSPKPCFVCGGPPGAMGIFVPDKPWEFSPLAPRADSMRAISYWVCKKHFDATQNKKTARATLDLIEAKIRAAQ